MDGKIANAMLLHPAQAVISKVVQIYELLTIYIKSFSGASRGIPPNALMRLDAAQNSINNQSPSNASAKSQKEQG